MVLNQLPFFSCLWVTARKADHRNPQMTSPYLDRALLPLADALPRMLEQIETDLATAVPAEK
jgi:hypothetical protein